MRNIRQARLGLGSGLNLFVGANAQGKTSLLEAVGLVARGRSFRTEAAETAIRRGSSALVARALAHEDGRPSELAIELSPGRRRLQLDGRDVPPGRYYGRLEVVVYSTDRLRVVRGGMRERRAFVDRQAAAVSPAYRRALREFERMLVQRNAALKAGTRDLPVWSERFVASGAELRERRAAYVERLSAALLGVDGPAAERYEIALAAGPGSAPEQRERLAAELAASRREEQAVRRTRVGPHRDAVALRIDDEEALEASSGQARSLLLALALATLEVYRQERGHPAVALLDDLDSELDEERASAVCREVARRGQALVTSAHPAWARRAAQQGGQGRLFEVHGGEVRCA